MGSPISIIWFRLDLRLHDHPALLAAQDAGPDGVLPLMVLDEHFWGPGARVRQAYLVKLLEDFQQQVPELHIAAGDPRREVPRIAQLIGANSVHISADFTPYGAERDADVTQALGDVELVRTGSSYAIAPGRITKGDGDSYRVFTPFYKRWLDHGWRRPPGRAEPNWITLDEKSAELPKVQVPEGLTIPELGERAARDSWQKWLSTQVSDYHNTRDLPGDDVTSRMSAHLKWGTIHPRTLLADLAEHDGAGPEAYRRELAFREFYADVLHRRPDSAFGYYNRQFESMEYDEPGEAFEAWQLGQTGYPIVDAGMRQLRAEGWMHNRVRMIVASFLVKDLHIEWTHGASHFLDWLVDGDLASNQHGWQWVAGCGTDASPYFRIFNPVTQSKKFDPNGDYLRRWVPELAGTRSKKIHEPWELSDPPAGYPGPIVDHAEERAESLRRYNNL